jgi:hypothetical protein
MQQTHTRRSDLVFPLHACVFQARFRLIKINLKSFEQFNSVFFYFSIPFIVISVFTISAIKNIVPATKLFTCSENKLKLPNIMGIN